MSQDSIYRSLPARPPEGFADDATSLDYDTDIPRLTVFKTISHRAIQEARWLRARTTDTGIAEVPYSRAASEIADSLYPGEEPGSYRDYIFTMGLLETLERIVDGRLELPGSLLDDQVEDWIIARVIREDLEDSARRMRTSQRLVAAATLGFETGGNNV